MKRRLKKIFNSQLSTLHYTKRNESGQILIIILLVLVVGVSIVLSLASRSLTDIRTTTSTEQSNRAYFAAEAGIERALQQIKDGTVTTSTTIIDGSDVNLSNNARFSGNISITGGSADAFVYDAVKDLTFQTNLKPDINSPTSGMSNGSVTVYWHTAPNPTANNTAALEVTLLRNVAGTYSLVKFACDPFATEVSHANGFNCSPATITPYGSSCTEAVTVSNRGSTTSMNFCYSATFSLGNVNTVLMRVRPLYSTDTVAVKYNGTDNSGKLPQQGYQITSTGVGPDGATRKLVVYRSFPSLPSIFDFVLFNGSSNPLTKP